MSRKQPTRQDRMRQRAEAYGKAILRERRQAIHDARTNPTYAPEPIPDALAHAYERGYRQAISDLRRELANDLVAKSIASTIMPLIKFLRPMR